MWKVMRGERSVTKFGRFAESRGNRGNREPGLRLQEGRFAEPRLSADTRDAFLFFSVHPSVVTVVRHRASSEATLSLEFVATLNATASHHGNLRAMVLGRQ